MTIKCRNEGLGVFNTLQRLGIPSRFVYFASENHWVSLKSTPALMTKARDSPSAFGSQVLEPHNGVRWHEEVLKWIDEWTSEEATGNKEVVATPSENAAKSGYDVAYSAPL
jgi:dipeptidyl aminopeptidase/acylaminoacyl peptidase